LGMRQPVKKAAKKASKSKIPPQKDLNKVADRIRQLRLKRGYTSYEIFAFENNINRAQFGRYERGEDLRISSLFKVLRALKVTPKEFFSEGFEKFE
jgi:transcriptional regulator with XRE-family HTH domain